MLMFVGEAVNCQILIWKEQKNPCYGKSCDDSCQQRKLKMTEPIRNFHEVEPYLFRGGQPVKEGFYALKDLGVKTVVCLRWGKKVIAAEKASVESLGMTFVSMPLNYWNLPKQETVDHFLKLIDDESNHPLFVHCFHGSDRTGILIAIFRMLRQGWTFHDSYREMVKFGFHRFRLQNFKWWLRKYTRKAGFE